MFFYLGVYIYIYDGKTIINTHTHIGNIVKKCDNNDVEFILFEN